MMTGHSHDFFTTFHGKIVFLCKKSSLFICVCMLPVWCQKTFSYRIFSVVCYVYGSCMNSYLFFMCGVTLTNHWNLQKSFIYRTFYKFQKYLSLNSAFSRKIYVFYMRLSIKCIVPVCSCMRLWVIHRGNNRS